MFPFSAARLTQGNNEDGRYSTFQSVQLVEQKNFDDYLQVMDEADEKRREGGIGSAKQQLRSSGYANWFTGQQLFLDVSGNLKYVWKTRADNEEKLRGDL